jgi:hypothetical protein
MCSGCTCTWQWILARWQCRQVLARGRWHVYRVTSRHTLRRWGGRWLAYLGVLWQIVSQRSRSLTFCVTTMRCWSLLELRFCTWVYRNCVICLKQKLLFSQFQVDFSLRLLEKASTCQHHENQRDHFVKIFRFLQKMLFSPKVFAKIQYV